MTTYSLILFDVGDYLQIQGADRLAIIIGDDKRLVDLQ